QRHGHKHSAALERGRRDNVVRLAPLEMRVLSVQSRLQREAILHVVPERGGVQAGRRAPIRQGQNESALQRRDVFPKLFGGCREISARKRSLKFVRLRDGLCFRGRILARVIIEQRRHGGG